MRKNILFSSIFILLFSIHIYASELPQMEDAPMSKEFLNYINVKQRSENLSGYIPEPYPIPYINREVSRDFPAIYNSNLENSYNTGSYKNFISPVKNQDKDGVCWSFSSTSVLESSLLKQTGNALDTYDFSENHMRYSLSYQGNNPLGFIKRYDGGGNFAQALAYWTRSKTNGPVLEIDDIYISGMGDSGIRDVSITNEKPVANYYVSKAIQLSNLPKEATDSQKENRIREIKQLIMDYGAVDSAYYTADDYYSDDTNAYFYDGNENTSNHAISIVGWDDNFSKAEFKIQPPKDGAFVVKNNWGSNWNSDGYFYISYYDKNITKAINTVAFVENKDFFDTIYEYDPFGKIASTSYTGTNVNVYANMFNKTPEYELLTAISTYCLAPNSYFKVYITDSDNFADFKEIEIKDLVKSEHGYNVSDTGYITFKLENPVLITNDKFGMAIEVYNILTTNDKVYTVPLEQKLDNYSPATQNSGESFIALSIEDLKSGYYLTDVSGREGKPANVCIKAFTKSVTYEITIDNTITGGAISSNLSNAKYGDEINLTITPDTGMKLKGLSYNDGTNNTIITGTTFKMPANNITIKAEFEPIIYEIKIDNTITGGKIVSNLSTAKYGDEINLTITPDTGMKLKSLSYNDGTNNTIITRTSFKMPANNITIKAEFEPIIYEIKIDNTIIGGTIVSNLSTAKYGDEINLTITPDTGMKLKSLSYNDGTNNTIITGTNFKMSANNITIKAEFEPIVYEIKIDDTITGGTISSNLSTAKYGDEINLTITPDNDMRLKNNSLNYSNGINNTIITGTTFKMPANNVIIKAEFEFASSVKRLEKAIESANEIYENSNSTAEELVTAIGDLLKAMTELER